MKKLFYIEQVKRNVTVVERYEVEAETFEEAIANKDKDPDSLQFTHIWEQSFEYMVEDKPEGWSLVGFAEVEVFDREAARIRHEKLREENPELFEEEELEMSECSCGNCGNL